MRRFRQSLKQPEYRLFDPSYDTKQLKDQVHLLTLLDNCSQILRDDRIWLRKRIKQNDQDVIQLLKASMKGQKQINMVNTKQLQINLRKYINRVKEIQKEQQLIKFKENVLANQCKRKKGKEYQNLSNCSSWKNVRFQQKRHNQSYSLPRQQSFFSKIPEPIEEQNSSQKESSYPSRSSQPFSHYQRQSNRSSFAIRKNQYSGDNNRRSSNEKQTIQASYGRESLCAMKQSKSYGILKNYQKGQGFDKNNKNLIKQCQRERDILKDLKLDTFRQKQQLMTFKPSQSIDSLDPFIKTNKKYNFSQYENNYSPFESIAVSNTPNHSIIEDKIKNSESIITKPIISNVQQSRALLPIKISQNDEDLFTSPQLLMECRLFIQRNSNSKRKSCCEGIQSKSLVSSLQNSRNISFKQNKIQQTKILDKYIQQVEEIQQTQQKQLTLIPFQAEQSFTEKSISKKKLQEQYIENIFDIIFGDRIIVTNFHQILRSNYQNTPTLQNLISRTGNQILYQQLGPLLQAYCELKQSNNPIRDVYNYIDLDKNGYFTSQDLDAFLSQVLQQQSDPMYKLGYKIFDMAQKDGKVQYWALYQIKQKTQMKEFVTFLSQFQFEVEA